MSASTPIEYRNDPESLALLGGLLNGRVLIVRPKLASFYGLNEAIVLQQLHWTLSERPSLVEEVDGRAWVHATLEHWMREFPFWSEATIRRIFANLKDRGVVETTRGRESNAYSINYLALDPIELDRTDQIDRSQRSDRAVQNDQIDRSPNKGEVTAESEEKETAVGVKPPPVTTEPALEPGQLFAAPGTEPKSAPKRKEGDPDEEKIQKVWTCALDVLGEHFRVKGLTDARRRAIVKALKAVALDDDLCCRAIHGLRAWRAAGHKGDYSLSTIFETGPHSRSNLTDQIEWWAGQANATVPQEDGGRRIPLDLAGVPQVSAGKIQGQRRQVVQMVQNPDDADAQERGKVAAEFLKQHCGHDFIVTGDNRVEWRYAE